MTQAAALRSGKGHGGENFPVASRLVKAEHREPILAFYEFVRTADDVADHAGLKPDEKLAILDRMEATLLGRTNAEPEGVRLRSILAERGLDPSHALDLLSAFKLDATKQRYSDFGELMQYCRYSAMPVGRFVLDVHGESPALWAVSDPLCAALQIINHVQDCKADYRDLDRVYVPLDGFAAHGAKVEMLGGETAPPALRYVFDGLCDRIGGLLAESATLSDRVQQARLGLEISVIQQLAERLLSLLRTRDPLSERVHLNALESASFALLGLLRAGSRRVAGPPLAAAGSETESRPAANRPGSAAAKAAGSSFYTAMRILPRERREAIFEVYAFCRAVDDIADQSGNRKQRMAALEDWRARIEALYAGDVAEDLQGLAAAVAGFGLKREDFLDVIDGMEMDVTDDIRAPELGTLELYCDRVASAVGRLCVRIFGMGEEDGIALSHHLGRALQLTNTLRDLDEDAEAGRLYLPREFLRQQGIESDDPKSVIDDPRIERVCRQVAALAFSHFAAADAIMSNCGRSETRAPRIMGDAYYSILCRLTERGFAPPRSPVRLGRARIALILLRRFVW
jgi:hydroxysqualene synthase